MVDDLLGASDREEWAQLACEGHDDVAQLLRGRAACMEPTAHAPRIARRMQALATHTAHLLRLERRDSRGRADAPLAEELEQRAPGHLDRAVQEAFVDVEDVGDGRAHETDEARIKVFVQDHLDAQLDVGDNVTDPELRKRPALGERHERAHQPVHGDLVLPERRVVARLRLPVQALESVDARGEVGGLAVHDALAKARRRPLDGQERPHG